MSETIHKISRKIFFDSPRFEVPRYQREYSWQSEQITQLLSDIDSIELNIKSQDDIEAITTHFVGLLVFINEKNDSGEVVFTVVDGQQRISTFVLVAAVAKDVIKELLDQPGITVDAANKLNAIKDLFDQYIYISSRPFGKKTQKLIPNNNDKDIYEILVLTEGSLGEKKEKIIEKFGKSGLAKRYFKAYQQIYSHLLEKSKEENFLINFFVKFDSGISFIPFISKSDTDAFNLFECLNDRGMRLSSIDLIKNKVLQHAKNDTELETFDSTWSETLGNNGVVATDQAQSFIRNYLMIKNGHISKDGVYNICKATLKSNTAAKEFLNDITLYGQNYRDITIGYDVFSYAAIDYINDEEISELIFLLNKSKVKQWQSLGLAAYHLYKTNEISRLNLIQLLNLLLKLSIRFKILNIRFNVIEKIIPTIANSLHKSTIDGEIKPLSEVVDYCKQEIIKLINRHVDDNKLKATLENGYLCEDNDLAFILLRIIAKTDSTISHGLTFSKVMKLTLEHVLPEKHEKNWGKIESVDEIKYSIGNMLLVEHSKNSKLSNKGFDEKCVIYNELNPLDLVGDPTLSYKQATQDSWVNSTVKTREIILTNKLKSLI